MNIDGMSYRQWQKRNTGSFQKLSKEKQKLARKKGYFNIGWKKVQQSWIILHSLNQPISLLEVKLQKNNLSGAVSHLIIEADKAIKVAKEGRSKIQNKSLKIRKLADESIQKYKLL